MVIKPIKNDLSTYKDVARSCWSSTQELTVPNDDRSRLSLGLLQLVQEHHASIVILIQHQQYGSAFALLRPLYEAYVRGVWLAQVASDREFSREIKGSGSLIFQVCLSHIASTGTW